MFLKLENEYSQFVTDHYCKFTSYVCLKVPENKIYLKSCLKEKLNGSNKKFMVLRKSFMVLRLHGLDDNLHGLNDKLQWFEW